MTSSMPSKRTSVEGETYEGERVRLSLSVAKKLYRCPSCRQMIGIGSDHVFVHYLDADPAFDHEHWHSGCAGERLLRNLARARNVPAPKAPRRTRKSRR